MTVPTNLPIGATAIADRATGNELKPNVDGSLNIGSGGGGGTQYTDGQTPPTNPIGGAIQFDNSGTWNDVGVDHPFPVQSPAGFIADLATLLTLSGTPTDANTVNSLMGRLTKIRDLLNATLTVQGTITEANSSAILAKIVTAPALEGGNLATLVTNFAELLTDTDNLATLVTQTLTPNVSDRWARQVGQVDLARVLGAALSATNPMLTKIAIQALISLGQGFIYTTGKQNNAAGTPTCGFSLFNPAASGKTIQIYSLRTSFQGTAMLTQLYKVTSGTDPALTSAGTKSNSQIGNATTSVASCTFVNANQAVPTSTEIDDLMSPTTSTNDYLTNNATIELLQGEGIYVAINCPANGTTANWFVTVKAVEY